ncbi:RrF2 family transcriptional regulator [Lactovum miscens]|uniref:Rrf2 family protein n=1 Tax=Lactovum miscens TaxID=190387 RepID=A0A841C9P3_9LACT|nr:Rrf2 family transcriptional regulator [Lactovum miscens]MBB5888302.1 Rrf2 family protein [Lactovum miscens]
MRLTKAFEQGVCVMAMLTTQLPDIPVSSASFYHRLGSSPTYTQKIIRRLVVAGLVTSVSGLRGGFCLSRSSRKITCLDVVEAIEGKVVTFPDSQLLHHAFANSNGLSNLVVANDIVHHVFSSADALWRSSLSKTSIAEIIHESLQGSQMTFVDWNEI